MRLYLLLLLLTLASAASGQDTPEGWVLLWEENFDARDAAFDARWDIGTHTFDGNEAQFVEDNVVVEDGLLTLRLTPEAAGSRQYSGAELRTDNGVGFFTYGRFEARMKAARGSGVISSLFTFRYDPWQEVDIEFKGRDTRAMQANIFYNQPGDNAPYEVPPFPRDSPLAYDAADEFHVYAFEWEPGIIRWFVDGEQVLESQNPAQVPYLPQQLMMNIWNTNLDWAGPLDPGALPTEAQYDWVRVYQRQSDDLVFDTFDDGDVSNVFTFSETESGIGVGPIADANGAPNRAVNVGIDPSGTGGYAGVVFAGAPGVTDASGASALTFQFRPSIQTSNLPLTLEVNLHEDTNGNDIYDGATEDEYQALVTVSGVSDFYEVSIPLSAFTDDNSVFQGSNDGFEYARLLEVVVAIVGPRGPGYSLSFDEIVFEGTATAGSSPPEASGVTPVVYPNPASGAATVAFDLAQASEVTVDLVDVLGRHVATLTRGPQAVGAVRVAVPDHLPPGLYIVQVTTDTARTATRFTVVR